MIKSSPDVCKFRFYFLSLPTETILLNRQSISFNNKLMKTKMIFAIAALLILGSVCLKAQENSNGSTPIDYSKQPFTIVPNGSPVNVTFYPYIDGKVHEMYSIFCSKDRGETWNNVYGEWENTVYVDEGEKLMIKIDPSGPGCFESFKVSDGTYNVEGNIMSVETKNYESATTVSEYAFRNFFSGHTNLISAENLVLPSTTLSNSCYAGLFKGCTSLTTAPELPATTLATSCYSGMFYGCTSLTTAPELPAKAMTLGCYSSMFEGCTSLTTAPELPATNLAIDCYGSMFRGCTSLTTAPELLATTLEDNYCYYQMFYGCTSLNYIKCLATIILDDDCLNDWVKGVASSGTFVKASSMNNWSTGASGIPSGWTVSNDEAVPSTPTDYSKQPFTIVPLEKDMTVWFLGERDDHVTESINVFYSYDGGETWIEKGFGDHRTISVNLGQKVSLRVNNCSSAWGIQNKNSEDKIVGRFNVEGVLERMSPCDGYKGYFKGMTTLVSAENLIIPEDTYCEEMFAGCTSLTKAPVLSASTLSENQYKNMFNGCTSLNYIKCLATDISASDCTDGWLDGVSSSGTFVKAASMNNWPSGASGIPSGWTVTNAQTNQTKRTIHVATAGTLPNLISEEEKYQIEELTLTGELNGTDFKLIREMAGVNDYYESDGFMCHDRTNGMLKSLDISKVNIVKGGSAYNFRRYPSLGDMLKIGRDCTGVAVDLYISDNSISEQLFSLTLLESIILPNNVVSIGDYAFFSCSNLVSVTIPNGVTSIGVDAFSACRSLTSITIPNSVTSIGISAFSSCSGLKSIMVESGNENYDSRNNCNAIIETSSNTMILGCMNSTIPNSVTSIGGSAFYGCSGLTSVNIPNSVTSIGSSAFFGCSGLTSIMIESGNQKYDSRNNCNAIIETSSNTMLLGCMSSTIPNTVTSIGSLAFYGCSGLTSVTIPNSVTSIGFSAFYNCKALSSVNIPNSVTSIYNGTFEGCSGLTSVNIPNSVTSIGSSAFSGTAWYNNQPDGLVYAGKIAYKYKGEMPANTSVIIKDGTLGITYGAFSGCSGLTSITIPNSVTSIGSYAFSGCSGLTSITIPNSVTSIGDRAFEGCNGLTKVVSKIMEPFKIDYFTFSYDIYSNAELVVPAGTNSLYEATEDWNKFSKITESPSAKRTIHVATAGTLPNLISEDEKYQIEELTLTGELNGTDFKFIREMAGDIVSYKNIPTEVKNLPNLTVLHNPTDGILTSLDLSNTKIVEGGENYNYIRNMDHGISGLSTIDNKITPGLFSQTNLETIILPNSITSIEGKSYSYMYFTDGPGEYEEYEEDCIGVFPQSLTSIYIPNSVTSIGKFAFLDCRGLTSITIPNSVTSIGTSAFWGSSGLTSLTIPNSVTSISDGAFANCSSLAYITVPNSLISIGGGAFSGTAWYNNQPDGLVYVGKVAYKYKGEMPANTQITIKDGTLGIAGSAFYGCSGLTSITIPNSVTSIERDAFLGCSGLTSITIPNSVTSIGSYAFNNCSGLTSITIPNSVISISNSAFSGCSGLTSITIPNSVTSIGYSAFSWCTSLTSITIPNSVTSIGSYAFSWCTSLTTITIPKNVTSIENCAFQDCSSLTRVVSKIKNPFTIEASVFPSDICSNAELIVPAGTKSLYEAADGWNKFSKITELLPTLETQPAQPTSTTKARLIALANEEDDDQHYGFEWLRNDAPANMPPNKVYAPLYDGRIIGSLGGLNPDIYYKYRPFYKSDSGEMAYGEWIPFLTGDANVFFEPEVHTKDAIVLNDGALLSAVFVEGTEDIQEKGFEYWPMNSNARAAVSLTRGNNIGSVIVSGNNTSVTIEGLKAGTEYGYRPYVKTASGITYGEEKTFKTLMLGDVNGDNKVDNYDLNDLVSYIMGGKPAHFNKDAADLNNDSQINAADIVKMVKILK